MNSIYSRIKHEMELIDTKYGRLGIIDKQIAFQGEYSSPPHLIMERNEIRDDINELQRSIDSMINSIVFEFEKYIDNIDDINIFIENEYDVINEIVKILYKEKRLYIVIDNELEIIFCRFISNRINTDNKDFLFIIIDFSNYSSDTSIEDWISHKICLNNNKITPDDAKDIMKNGFQKTLKIGSPKNIIEYIPVLILSCPRELLGDNTFTKTMLMFIDQRVYPVILVSNAESRSIKTYKKKIVSVKDLEIDVPLPAFKRDVPELGNQQGYGTDDSF